MPEIRRDESAGTAGKPLPSHTRVAVIGGGVVGCSILFHLAKFGWKDVILLEQHELTAGSSWHAAGMIHTLSSDPNISRLQGYTINLYKEIEETSGQSVGLNNTGGFYLASTRDWYDYLKRERSKARYMGLDQEFISPREVAERHPLIDPKHYYAALWDELDGDLDPSGATYAFAKSARVHGAQYFTHTPVVETNQRPDGSWDVVTPRGTVHAEHVVNCGGLWAREVGEMAGAALPVQPMEHHYLITEPIPAIVERMGEGGAGRLPGGIDYEANIYFRQERQGVLLGTYEPKSTPWNVSGTPLDFGQELLPHDLDRIADRLEMSFERIPTLGEAGIRDIICGPFTFGPDGNPLIGPVPGMPELLGGGGRHGGLLPGRRCRAQHRRVDDRRRAFDRRVGDGHRPLRRVRDTRMGHGQVVGELRTPLRDDLPQRNPAEGPVPEDHRALRPAGCEGCGHGPGISGWSTRSGSPTVPGTPMRIRPSDAPTRMTTWRRR